MARTRGKKKGGEEKRVNVFLIKGEFDPLKCVPKHPRLIMNQGDLEQLSGQKYGISYVPEHWLQNDAFKYSLPHIFLGGHILGVILPGGALEKIRSFQEEVVLLGKYPDYQALNEAGDEVWRLWKELQEAFARLQEQRQKAKDHFNKHYA